MAITGQALYDYNTKVCYLNKLIRKFIMKHGREPKVILIPFRKHKKYSIPEIAGVSRFESVCGVNIRYYDGTKTEVY